ncbi:MAG: galactose oxidase-like domain-containing protein, partial [Chloroflexota bacterium]
INLSPTADMLEKRVMLYLVVMADGQVMALAGNNDNSLTNFEAGVLPTEIWNPDTETWSPAAPINRTRQYHGTAILLPDGRIFAGGGGSCAGCESEQYFDAEFFSPPYLFNADGTPAERPVITSAPDALAHGDSFAIQTPNGDAIAKMHLIKLGSASHSQDMSQRLVPLSFSTTEDGLSATVPENIAVVIPGYYMLFIVNQNGVPSEAAIINIGGENKLTLNTPGDQYHYLNDEVAVELSVFNPTNYALQFTAEGLPDGLTLNQSTGIVEGQPTTSGLYTATLTVDGDAGAEVDQKTLLWEIDPEERPPNTPPTIVQPDEQRHAHGDAISLQIEAIDPDDGDQLTFLASGLPNGLTINPQTGLITGTITKAGGYFPFLAVRDAQREMFTTQFGWTVDDVPISIEPLSSEPQPTGAVITYTAVATSTSPITFTWDFGDGTTPVTIGDSGTVTHTYQLPGSYSIELLIENEATKREFRTVQQLIYANSAAGTPRSTDGLLIHNGSEGDTVWNVNPDNDSVTVFDLGTQTVLAEIAVPADPRTLAAGPDETVWVVSKSAGKISIIDHATLSVSAAINLPYGSQPYGILFSQDQSAAFVSLEAKGELLKIDPSTAETVGTLAVGSHARHLALNGSGTRLYLSRYITPPAAGEHTATVDLSSSGAELLVIDPNQFTLLETLLLAPSVDLDTDHSGRGLPNYLGPLIIAPGDQHGWVPAKLDNIERGALRDGQPLDFDNTVRSISAFVDLSEGSGNGSDQLGRRIDHDDAAVPVNGAIDRFGEYLFVVMEGSREIRVVDNYSGQRITSIPVGFAPQSISLTDDRSRLMVHNFLDRTVGIFDLTTNTNSGIEATLQLTYTTVTTDTLSSTILDGKRLFYDGKDPRLGRSPYLTCAACHNAGSHDGRTWDFTGMGEGLRNTIPLNGRGGMAHGPLHWSGNFDEIQDFENQIRQLNQGSGLMDDEAFTIHLDPLGDPKTGLSRDLDALAAYVSTLNQFDPSPFLESPDGDMSLEAGYGSQLFETLGCASCHAGEQYTDSALDVRHDIGTLKESSGGRLGAALDGLDTPTLRDLWHTAPYLHDGSAPTIPAAIQAHAGYQDLSEKELSRLAAFLTEIGGQIPDLPAEPTPTPIPAPSPTPSPQSGCENGSEHCIFVPLIRQ